MDVLRETFLEVLPLVKQAIEESDFVAIDTELTGLFTHNNRSSPFDDIGLRYSKVRDSAQAFRIIQFGLATFRYEPAENSGGGDDGGGEAVGRWVARPFNFYIFADEMDDECSEHGYRVFCCQPSSILFLSRCGFDFNKLFQHGIPYASLEDLRKRKARKELKSAMPDIPIDDGNRAFFENARNLVNEWLQNPREPKLVVRCPTSYHRRLVYQLLCEDVYNGRLAGAKGDRDHMFVTRLTDEEKRQQEGQEPKPNFGDVLEMVRISGKPVIGHNCLLDFCHTFKQFREELPDNLPGFKESFKQLWRTVFDTKHIATMDPFFKKMMISEYSTALGALYERVLGDGFEQAPMIVMPPSFNRYSSENVEPQHLHEAGYDAYCTGAIFARLAWLITGGQENAVGRIDFGHPHLVQYVNRVYVMNSDVQWISLDGPDDVPTAKPNHFYLRNLPPSFTRISLDEAFREYAPVAWRWVDQTTVWMIVKDAAKVSEVRLGDVQSGDAAGVTIMNWEQWYELKFGRQGKKEEHDVSSNLESIDASRADTLGTVGSVSASGKRKRNADE